MTSATPAPVYPGPPGRQPALQSGPACGGCQPVPARSFQRIQGYRAAAVVGLSCLPSTSWPLIEKAAELTGRRQKSVLIRLGLEALIARESGRRLARLGGTDPEAAAAPRRRHRA